jgi:hypothetical protein
LSQAARLFSLERADCERALQALVQDGHLTLTERTLASLGEDRRWRPVPGAGVAAATQWRLAGG